MIPTARHRGATNLLLCVAILAIGSLLVGLPISSLFHRSLGESFRLAGVFLTGLGMILSLVLWLLGLHAAGRVLLDCGPHPMRTLWIIDAAVSLALGLWGWTLFGPIFIPMRNLLYDPGFRAVAGSGKRYLAVLGTGTVGED